MNHFDIVSSEVLHASATCFLEIFWLVTEHAKNIDPAAIEGAVLSSTKLLKIDLIAMNCAISLMLELIGKLEQYLSIKSIGLDDSSESVNFMYNNVNENSLNIIDNQKYIIDYIIHNINIEYPFKYNSSKFILSSKSTE